MADEIKAAVASAVVEKANASLNAQGAKLDAKAESFIAAHKFGALLLAAASFVAGFIVGKFL